MSEPRGTERSEPRGTERSEPRGTERSEPRGTERVESLLRATLTERAGSVDDLVPSVDRVRTTVRRRRTGIAALAALAVAAIAGGTILLWPNGARPVPPATPPGPTASAPDGYRLESSLGVQLAVPDTWAINALACGNPSKPTILRGNYASTACIGPDKGFDYVSIKPSAEGAAGLPVGSPPADAPRLAPGADALSAAQVGAAIRTGYAVAGDAVVRMRVKSDAVATTILRSLRRVDVDANGCATMPHPTAQPAAPATGPLLPSGATSVTLCGYDPADQSDLLQASVTVSGAQLTKLQAAVQAAAPGPNPDTPATMCGPRTALAPDVLLVAHYAGRPDVRLAVRYSGCVGRGLDDGQRVAQVTSGLALALIGALHTGAGFSGDLPK